MKDSKNFTQVCVIERDFKTTYFFCVFVCTLLLSTPFSHAFDDATISSESGAACFYGEKDYRGSYFCTNEDKYWLGWKWYWQISSISIPDGKQVALYPFWAFLGSPTIHSESVPELSATARWIGSIKISDSNTNNDIDNDGVTNSLDLCPDTASGESVNPDGCALNQLDSDADGVNDALDLCADTPGGESVSGEGCSASQIDSDNDGLSDALDQCPNTPVNEPVNNEGCGLSQLDEDSDGVSDSNDQCPGTAYGAAVDINGCTPSQLDTDSDGINDALDLCPQTPTGEFVGGSGCGFSQLDTDQDGISDDVDQCPETTQNQATDNTGCSSDQIIDDAGIVLLTPQATENVAAAKTLVTGSVDWQGELGVTINGQVAMLSRNQTPTQFGLMLEVPEGFSEIAVVATNQFGKSATLSVSISASIKPDFLTELFDQQGFAPFTAEVQFSTESEQRLISIEIDFDADGEYEVVQQAEVGSFLDITQVFEHIYASVGMHFVKTRIQDESGRYFEQKLVVNVVDKQLLRNQLIGKWETMNGSILNDNIKLAMIQLSIEAGPQYQQVFQALQPVFQNILNEYSPMHCEDTALSFASCALVRTNEDSGERTLHFINFVQDGRGLWKISGM